ncbi:efflux RND transporter periplasmic adaptor subunit [Paenibacillus glacialis]|nr:efflux RND transporter periplasmic adaptor subunit [Paenibacillus glacialis]
MMGLQHTEQANSGRKRTIRIFSGLFIGLLIVFTLLSNTLMSLTLPKVAVVEPKRGQLVHMFQSSSVLMWKAEVALTNSTGWKVTKVDVKEGDLVKKGQTLVTYDRKEAEQQILDEQASLKKLKLTMEELQGSFKEASWSGDENSIGNTKREIEISKIDQGVQQRKIQKLQEYLINNSTIVAPFDGIVTKVNATEGLISSNGGPDVQMSNGSLGFMFELLAPANIASMLKIGEKIDVQVDGSQIKQAEGQIAEILDANSVEEGTTGQGETTTLNSQMKRLLITIQDGSFKRGDIVKVELTKPSAGNTILISNKAIHEDGSGKYVYRIEERNSPLGNAFYIKRVSITVVDSNDQESAVTGGIFEQDQIVVDSSQPLQDGNKVRTQ